MKDELAEKLEEFSKWLEQHYPTHVLVVSVITGPSTIRSRLAQQSPTAQDTVGVLLGARDMLEDMMKTAIAHGAIFSSTTLEVQADVPQASNDVRRRMN